MDSEEHDKIQKLIATGRSANDEGPFYHHTFWESYKGAIKGKLGGLIIGGLIGVLVGGIAFGIMAIFAGGLSASGLILGTTISAKAIIGGLGVAGMVYGAHEFSEVGRVSGAVAAGLDDSEKRNHEFELAKFSEMKKEIGELKAMIAGQKAANDPTFSQKVPAAAANDENFSVATANHSQQEVDELERTRAKLAEYRTTHHRDDVLKSKGLIYWKVMLVGALAGIGVGLLLASGVGGVAAAEILSHIGIGEIATVAGAKTLVGIGSAELMTTSAIAFGTIGASFGISRDFFRMVFDKTDTVFKGVFDLKHSRERQKQPEIELQPVAPSPRISTLVYHTHNNDEHDYEGADFPYAKSVTYYRDMIPSKQNNNFISKQDKDFATIAKEALASLDHTQARRN